jgi:pyruvate dehydrogenase E2 component (dihydrolipoamide acetyltransferase)
MQMPVVEAESLAGPQGDPLAVAATNNLRISPKARRLAKEHGVDITKIRGTGPGGEIVAEDVLAAKSAAPASSSAPRAAASPVSAPSMPSVSTELGALSSIGRIMAERTTQSWTTAPHFFVSREVDGTGLVAAREKFGPDVERTRSVKLTYTDLLTAVIAKTLRNTRG